MEKEDGVFSHSSIPEQSISMYLGGRKVYSPKQYNELLCRLSLLAKNPKAAMLPRESVDRTSISKHSRLQSGEISPCIYNEAKHHSVKRRRRKSPVGLVTLSKPQRNSMTYKGILLQQNPRPGAEQITRLPLKSTFEASNPGLLPPIRTCR